MVMFWYFFTYSEFDRNTQPQHNTTNITTMAVKPFAPSAAWIRWVHTAQGVGVLVHILSKTAVEQFFVIQ